MQTKESLTFENVNDLHRYMETVAALLDRFVSIIYANYYMLMEIRRAIVHIQYCLHFVECF